MKYPIYTTTLLALFAGVSWAVPPTKSHHSIVRAKNAKAHQEQMQQTKQTASQRPTTIALDVGKGKAKAIVKGKRNQFQAYHHRNKGH
tara:strand:- start:3362 stop:3625 length:264 start_codon:yes stop_codon:yes gene_type:complete